MERVVDSCPGTVGATGHQVKGEDGGKSPEQDVCISIIVKLQNLYSNYIIYSIFLMYVFTYALVSY